MQLFVRGIDNHTVEVNENANLGELKNVIASNCAIPIAEQILSFGGRPLDGDAAPLSEFGVQHQSTIDVSVPLLGGKVHGSLARAGKVRGQTPKVEKKEKKKKLTGRAKRRMQYNRRFVNVVTTPGRRKGPNANV